MAFIILPKKLGEKLREKAEKKGLFPEELAIEFMLKDLGEKLDPDDLAENYQTLSEKYFEEAKEFLNEGDLVQASEKFWGAASLTTKMVAAKKGLKLERHGSIWDFIDRLSKEKGDEDILRLFHSANSLHRNFYENQMTQRAVKIAGEDVKKLIEKLR